MLKAALLGIVCVLTASVGVAQSPVADRVLPSGTVSCAEMTPRCAWAALSYVGVPAVLELLERQPERDLTSSTPLEYGGKKIRDLLDAAVAADPRYEWREVEGIPVLRPKAAWDDKSDVLNQRLESPFVLSDADVGLAAMQVAGQVFPRTDHDTRRRHPHLTLELANPTMLDALVAISSRDQHITCAVTLGNYEPMLWVSIDSNFRFGAAAMVIKRGELRLPPRRGRSPEPLS